MSISLRSRFWRIILREMLKEQRVSIEESRARSEQNARFMPRPRADVKVETINVDGIRAIWIQPPETEPNKVILHLHGGGYVIGSIAFYQTLCVPMAQTLRMNLLLPEYRLAPEHPYPAALEDALQMYNWLLAQGYKPADILLSGDSAGGGLSLATVLALKEAGTALPGTVACLSPWADLTLKGQSHITKAKSEVMLKTETLKEWALCYTTEMNLTNPLVSPIYADFHNFPPLLIQVGSEEILLDDALRLAEKARVDGVDVTLKVWEGMWHVWQALGNMIPESRLAFEELGRFERAHRQAGTRTRLIT